MKTNKKSLRFHWFAYNILLAACAYYGFQGVKGAGNILTFLLFIGALLAILVTFVGDTAKQMNERGRYLPTWITQGFGGLMLISLVWHGWFFTAACLAISEFCEAMIYAKPDEPQKPTDH